MTKNIWNGKEFETLVKELKQIKQFTPTFILDDYYRLIDTLNRAIDHLHKSYIEEAIHLEYVKKELIKQLDRKSLTNEGLKEESIISSMIADDILLIQLDHLLPMIKDENLKEKHFFNELRNFYVPALSNAILRQNPNFESGKVFVAIVQYYPKRIIRDVDNHFIKFVFNSLRYSGIVPDDTYENIFYLMFGTLAKKDTGGTGYSEIYITESKNMLKVIELLPLEDFLVDSK